MNAIVLRILDRHRNLLLMGAALLCGGIAVYAGSRYMDERLQQERLRLAPAEQQLVDIVVARRDLDKGEEISAETMALRQVPVDFVPSHAILPEQFEALVGQRLLVPMRSGEALSSMALLSLDQQGFSSRLKPGVRALTISVDEINSISGMLQPGDRIDLLLTARPPAAAGRIADHESTVPLLQNLLVLATGQRVRPGHDDTVDSRGFSAVTVEVEPAQAQRLVAAQRAGRLTAVLRNPGDSVAMAATPIDLRHLFNQPLSQPVAAPRRVVRRDTRPQIIMGGMGRAQLQPMGVPTGVPMGAPMGAPMSAPMRGTVSDRPSPEGEASEGDTKRTPAIGAARMAATEVSGAQNPR